ncbi:hypothetical protein ACIPSA_31250 [Streptomyces sp. NPDC086549]|uniref:hypothetical protein n=1 Tax=Streptomyces sp. NPDC086549 TaxID=3365752 RepID=UPI00380CED58
MVAVTEAGDTVYPMIPTYYNVPETLEQLRDEFVERVLQFLGLPGTDRYQWDGSDTAARAHSSAIADSGRQPRTHGAVTTLLARPGRDGPAVGCAYTSAHVRTRP